MDNARLLDLINILCGIIDTLSEECRVYQETMAQILGLQVKKEELRDA